MSEHPESGQPESYEYDFLEYVQRGEAIAHAHSKLLLARRKDVALRIGGAEGTHRHVLSTVRDLGQGNRRHAKVTLIPPRDNPEQGGDISQLQIEVPTQTWNEADEHAQTMYVANTRAQQITTESFFVMSESGPTYVPSPTLFVTARKTDGSEIRAMLSPESLTAFEFWNEVEQLPKEQVAAGQEYRVIESNDTLLQQDLMTNEWFDAEKLRDILAGYEPIISSTSASTDSVA